MFFFFSVEMNVGRGAYGSLMSLSNLMSAAKANETCSFLSSAPHNVISPLLLLGVMTCHYLLAAQWALASGAGTETHCLISKGWQQRGVLEVT